MNTFFKNGTLSNINILLRDEGGENPTIHDAVHPTVWGMGDQLKEREDTEATGALYGMAGVEEDSPPPTTTSSW